MNRTRSFSPARLPRPAIRAAALVLAVSVAACAGSKDSATADSAAAAAPAATSAPTPDVVPENRPVTTDSAAGAAGATAGAAEQTGAMLDPNTATRDQLVAVPGMTAAAADAVIAGRPHATMIAVDAALAKSLSADARKTIYARLWKPIDLNKATGPEILLIPGVGPRMRHEFEEYRPYTSIEQFRREMGKYVDKAEVARLEKYVALK